MEASILLIIILQLSLIVLNAIFACAEIAVLSMNDAKLAKLVSEGDTRALRLARLTSQPARFLATIQVAITLSGFLGSAFAAENFSDRLVSLLLSLGLPLSVEALNTIAVVVITLALSYLTLVFGELVPKRIAMRRAEALALGMSALIVGISKVFAPIVWFLTLSTNGILRLLGIDPNTEDSPMSEDDIRMMVDVGNEKGVIDHEEKLFIQNVFEFDDLTAAELATHRTDVRLLWLEDSAEQWREIIYHSSYNLYPICTESADNIVGVLYAKDYLRLPDQSRENVMKEAVRPAYFVPESVTADVLFRNMKQSRHKLAVVLDEHGGMHGIISIFDLVEKLVGKLSVDDAELSQRPKIQKISDIQWRVSGEVSLNELSKTLKLPIPTGDYDTLNGLIFDALGEIPLDDSTHTLETAGLHIQLTTVRNHQVETALVSPLAPHS